MKMLFRTHNYFVGIFSVFMILFFQACTKEDFSTLTDERVNITGYLEGNPAYSEFSKILKITGTSSYLGAYGTYTIFAPTNDAVDNFVKSNGKASIHDFPLEELKDLVRLHLIADTISTTFFTDGKIVKPTMAGQYLTTLAQNEDGVTRITINKEAKIVQPNIRVGNGIIHVIDRVLIKSQRTLTEEIKENPELSIFYQALVATGWDIELGKPLVLKDSIWSYVSVLAVTNDVYRENNINSFDDLKSRYSDTGNPADPTDSLYLYVAYRVLPGLKYIADIVSANSHLTAAPLEVVSVIVSKDTVLLNQENFAGQFEKGVSVDRLNSDVTTKNGVLHYINGDIYIKKRLPTPVYFDVADQPEIRILTDIFRIPGKTQRFGHGAFKYIKWGGSANRTIDYFSANTGGFSGAYHSDYINLTLRNNAATIPWIEFTTPVIIRGKYKVWITYRNQSSGNTCTASFDGVPLSRTVTFSESRNTSLSPAELEQQGFKAYLSPNSNSWSGRLLGTIDVQSTDRHVLRLDAITNTGGNAAIDMIHFIPVDQNQLVPLFGPRGEIIF